MKYIDLSHKIEQGMPVYPGDPAVVFKTAEELPLVTEISFGLHSGTHIDAPAHIIVGGKNLDEYRAEKFFGRGILIDARGRKSADADLLSGLDIRIGDIVLVMFGWSEKFGKDEYYKDYPDFSESFAQKLVDLKISIVGIDTSSPDRPPFKIHKILLEKDILIVENLTNLKELQGQNNFEIIALPANFKAEAAPCRVVAKIYE